MKKILLIHTGGTFGMMPAEPSKVLAPADIQNLILEHLPEVEKIARVDFEVAFNIDSANIQIHHWQKLGQIIHQNYEKYDGFVVIHGTDAMVYTAAALSFMFRGLNKPIILTGSQRPLAQIRSDARSNLINSLELATYAIPEVAIFFGTHLYRGNRTIKISSTHYDAFASPNFPPLAEVGLDISLSRNMLVSGKELFYSDQFDNRVISFRFHPGISPDTLEYLVDSPIKIVVIEALGVGNLAIQENSVIPWIEKMNRANKLIVVNSQSPYGRVDLSLYECGKMMSDAGAIGAGDMTGAATIIKSMYLAGQYPENYDTVRQKLLQSIAGEITLPENY
ncbi:MAG: asparaginase [Calditrichia bacterium]